MVASWVVGLLVLVVAAALYFLRPHIYDWIIVSMTAKWYRAVLER
jgi:hypothetical protein